MEKIHVYKQGNTPDYIFNSPRLQGLREISAYDEVNDENNMIDILANENPEKYIDIRSYSDLLNCLKAFDKFNIVNPPYEFLVNLQNFMNTNDRRIACGIIINTFSMIDIPNIKNLVVQIYDWEDKNKYPGALGYYIKKIRETPIPGSKFYDKNYFGIISDIKYCGAWQSQKRIGGSWDCIPLWEIYTLNGITTEYQYSYEGYSFFCTIKDPELIELLSAN